MNTRNIIGLTAVFLLPFFIFGQTESIRIAFGSCGHQDKDLSILDTVVTHQPALFVFLGDNIYGDTRNMRVLKKKYRKLGRNSHFKKLKSTTPILATWDDHDYGENDAGRHYPCKKQSKKIMLRFFDEPKSSNRWTHDGIYTTQYFTIDSLTIQFLLLDLRTFRDNLLSFNKKTHNAGNFTYDLDYAPYQSGDSTLLGTEQWIWLENELKQPADIRIICSSTQFGTAYNGYETWANFPHEQERMKTLIRTTKANGIVFISGDVHYGELSRQPNPGAYDLFDLTSSGLTEEWKFACPNGFRVGQPVRENHFGIIELKRNSTEPLIEFQLWDKQNTLRLSETIKLNSLTH
jgi:alkaline phosphatase D